MSVTCIRGRSHGQSWRQDSAFFEWLLAGDLDDFYGELRWPEWRAAIAALSLDEGLATFPPLWSVPNPLLPLQRSAVPIGELWQHSVWSAREIR